MKHTRSRVLPSTVKGALLVAAFLLGSVLFQFSFAQTTVSSQSLEVSPPSQEFKADPGQTFVAKAKVRNKGSLTIPVAVRVQDFTATGQEGQVALTEESKYSVTSWVDVSPKTFTLSPGASQEVVATVQVPSGAAGGRYGSFVFSVGGGKAGPGEASVAQEVASLFLIRISGPVTEKLTITAFTAPGFTEFGPVSLSITFQNNGNVHLKPTGLINIRNIFGKTSADIIFPGENVFPGVLRIEKAQWDKKFLLGPYTAQAVLTFGSKNEPITSTVTFFAFPVRLAAAVLLVGFALYLLRKRLAKAAAALTKP
ncbi:hypothetical protein HY086_04065 [Candidatus Gottesmanbacteria bacterium]|nr:hypothetical protein [Candidatus Gottesmanbacteria bacterium]